ncbi:hypothetical protein DL96DRAFT_1623723 [Flagelloscypha sp. PMI_526]|nr:hypothetical protein DL96DRAFT_1623723 [Flagelloscypha sp. PMI_526]
MAVPLQGSRDTASLSKTKINFSPTLVITFDVLLIVGFVVCTGVLLTACTSKRIVRSRPWYIFMGLGSFWSIQYSLLLGNQLTIGPPPPFLCLIQSSFIYAAPPGNVLALLGLFLQIYLLLVEAVYDKPGLEKMISPFTLGLPFLAYLLIFLIAIANGLQHSDKVVRNEAHFTCHHASGSSPFITSGLVLFASGLIIILEGLILMIFLKKRSKLHALKVSKPTSFVSFSIFIRSAIFSLLPLIAICVSISRIVQRSMDTPRTPIPDLMMACLPLLAGVIFGSQTDMIAVWMFWKKPSYHAEPKWQGSV